MSDKTKPGVGVSGTEDIFAVTGEPPVEQAYLALGNDWAQIIEAQRERADEIIVVNMGPQHPSWTGAGSSGIRGHGRSLLSRTGRRPGSQHGQQVS